MDKDELLIDKIYDDMYSKYMERTKVPYESYEELEEAYEHLRFQIQELIGYIRCNDIAGAYEYAVSEGLV